METMKKFKWLVMVVLMASFASCATIPPMNRELMPKKLYFSPIAYDKDVPAFERKVVGQYIDRIKKYIRAQNYELVQTPEPGAFYLSVAAGIVVPNDGMGSLVSLAFGPAIGSASTVGGVVTAVAGQEATRAAVSSPAQDNTEILIVLRDRKNDILEKVQDTVADFSKVGPKYIGDKILKGIWQAVYQEQQE